MLSNRIWNMPTATRSEAPGTATIFFRCGSQQGKQAKIAASDLQQDEFDLMTVEFLSNEIALYSRARSARQKNASRNLKKYLDSDDVRRIEEHPGAWSAEDVATLL